MNSVDVQEVRGGIGATIKQLRLERELTLSEVSVSAGLSVSYISDIERGRTEPSLHSLRQIAQALYVPVKAIFQAEGSYLSEPEWMILMAWRSGDIPRLLHTIAECQSKRENLSG